MAKVTQSTATEAVTGFTWDDVSTVKTQIATDAIARQQAFLAANPDYAPCIIPGCTGSVGPDLREDGSPKYIKIVNGLRTGFCPRTKAHDFLRAQHEAELASR